MFSSSIQPALVSLFSSTGSDPLSLFAQHTDSALPADSVVCILNDTTSLPHPPGPATLIAPSSLSARDDGAEDDGYASGSGSVDYTLNQSVLHIQSPTLRTTYVRCPPAGVIERSALGARKRNASNDLGMEHPWLHMQIRNMGREWSFEVGVVDQGGKEGVVRCSTFQVLFRSFMLFRVIVNYV